MYNIMFGFFYQPQLTMFPKKWIIANETAFAVLAGKQFKSLPFNFPGAIGI
jgi:hypothetical protein